MGFYQIYRNKLGGKSLVKNGCQKETVKGSFFPVNHPFVTFLVDFKFFPTLRIRNYFQIEKRIALFA